MEVSAQTHCFLALWHQSRPYATHGQLYAGTGVVLVAVQPGDESGEIGGQLLLCLGSNGGETKCCTLCEMCMCGVCGGVYGA